MLYEAVEPLAMAIRLCEELIPTRNLPKGVEDSIRRAESELCDALGTIVADLHAVTQDLPAEVERQSIPEMIRIAVKAQQRQDEQRRRAAESAPFAAPPDARPMVEPD